VVLKQHLEMFIAAEFCNLPQWKSTIFSRSVEDPFPVAPVPLASSEERD